MKNQLKIWGHLLDIGTPKEVVLKTIVEYIYSQYKDDTLKLFLTLQELEKKEIKKEKEILHFGLQDAMHGLSALGSSLLEEKTSRQAKATAKFYFRSENLANLINICKPYFPDGVAGNASASGEWFFKQFVNLLIKHKDKYTKGGDSYDWVKQYDHEEYINLVLKNNDINVESKDDDDND